MAVTATLLGSLTSCTNDLKTKPTDAPNLAFSLKEDTSTFSFDYLDLADKERVLQQLSERFLQEIYGKDQFDTRYSLSKVLIKDHKDKQKLEMQVKMVALGAMSPEELSSFLMFFQVSYLDSPQAQTEVLQLFCDSSNSSTKDLSFEKPSDTQNLKSEAKVIAQFISSCIQDQEASSEPSSYFIVGPNIEALDLNQEDLQEYTQLLEKARETLKNS